MLRCCGCRRLQRLSMYPVGRINASKDSREFFSTTISPDLEQINEKNQNGNVHVNPCKIQMISDQLFDQVFIDRYRQKVYSEDLVEKCRRHLEAHNLWGQNVDIAEPIKFHLPELEGNDINHHFQNIARQQTFRYKNLLDKLVKTEIPALPTKWVFDVGWTKYHKDGRTESVPFPVENAMVFDVEVCMSHGQVPTLACALTTDGWYSWCSSSLFTGISRNPSSRHKLDELIPLETLNGEMKPPQSRDWVEKIVIGHNVSYDRARIKEQYFLEKTKLRFMDTMSLHIAVSGITSFQRALKMSMKSRMKREGTKSAPGIDTSALDWDELSSLNNLSDVHNLYCKGEVINKDERNIFVKGTLQDVRDNFQSLALYCAKDVRATHEILQHLLPSFYERFPHPVTLCGMLEMGTTYLPINQNWVSYMNSSEEVFKQSENEVKSILVQKANDALKLLENERYKTDPWLWDLDWKISKKRSSKKASVETDKNTQSLQDTHEYPAWYKKLLYKPGDPDYQPGPSKISSSMQIVPKLLKLTWFGFPLHHSKTGKWGFLVKKSKEARQDIQQSLSEFDEDENDDNENENATKFPFRNWEEIYDASKAKLVNRIGGSPSTDLSIAKEELNHKSEELTQDLSDFLKGLKTVTGRTFMQNYPTDPNLGQRNSPHPDCEFIPLPHKNGVNYKVGNPLGKDFLSKIEEGILSCQNGQDVADKVVKISKQSSYWRNNRDRIFGQMTVWYDNQAEGTSSNKQSEMGAIVPQVVVAGTLTRRAVEPTWMTASNAYEDRIGSELKSMVQAPPSYNFVGADVDSQELWIASVIGDAHFATMHGCTALGWMTLQGTKNSGTDMHSKTASVSGISREHAKVLNYARIYGAGVKFAERLLLQFNRTMSPNDARQKAKLMFKMTKGDRKYLLNHEGQQLASQSEEFEHRCMDPMTKPELVRIMSFHHFPYREYMSLVDKLVWDNGTESFMFNRLEEIAQEENPQTPVLGGLISRSLIPSVVHDDYMTSRVNWVVQSSAVDYLHLMLTCMGWLIKKFNLNARFSISVHDEVRYLVHSDDKYKLALALQITNLLTRSFCSHRLGIYDLPQSVAFFSCVDIDTVLRKEVTHDCKTPSNPQGLAKMYNIPEGEALDIRKTLEFTNGSLVR
ncbi:DNA polymerase subunit gamma-1 isoform X1 [Folsomia candida]|uniref:DNA polymerase subunit gamma-1 isoform X1 n=1 Tax=Folsomia candida TaxID=158441 RepID=UPI001604AD03|nr:DNA polymerase subunit gamma-1 isoform X1 [Folsomia candida]XP_035700700.1 DNA polymerase subunit gamma-1 isoform X1 [Folsomia candida]